MNDIKRISCKQISYLLKHFPCVAILGARQVGKTTLLKQVRPKASIFDLEKRSDFERISMDPDFFLSQYHELIIIDEAQSLPSLFPALRVAIDLKRDKKGRYLISGSASPELLKKISESLAGRIAIFELGGFCLEEAHQTYTSFYDNIYNQDIKALLKLKPKISTKQLLTSCLLGGYPEPFLNYRKDPNLFTLWMENYIQTYIKRDIRNLFPGLNIENFQRFIKMLAGSSGTILNLSEFARSLDISQPTVKSYFDIAHNTFLYRTIQSYSLNIKKRIIKMPKGHLRDSGILNFFMHNHSAQDILTNPFYGRIWESFIIEELVRGFKYRLLRVEPYHYRTSHHAEIDIILKFEWGLLPIEIKAGTITPRKNIITLQQFLKEHDVPLGLVINNSQQVTWLAPNILQIPAGCL